MFRAVGLFICLAVAAAAAAFAWGIYVRSYWAIAVPVAFAVFAALGLVLWIGWTLVTSEWAMQPPASPKQDGPDRASGK